MRNKTLLMFSAWLFLICFSTTAASQSTTTPASKNPLRITGNLITQAETYFVKGIETTRQPFTFLTSGNFDPEIYGVKLPFSFLLSNRSFNFAQPFNRLGISPEYKWLRLHFGYRNLSFSRYSLAGHTFLGGGIELNPGLLRLSALYGRFKKKTIPDNTVNPMDTLIAPMRYGYAVKLGVGNEKNFVDLIFMHIKDDTLGNYAMNTEQLLKPQANVVSGVNLKLTFIEKLVLESEFCLSFLTKDLHAAGIEEIGLGRFDQLAQMLTLNLSSSYSIAMRTALNYTTPGFSGGVEYRRIEPDYSSFGAYFFNTDIENITVNIKTRLLDKKLSVRGNIGVQNDNLKNHKVSRSSRLIAMLTMQYNPTQIFSIDGSYSNYSINQKAGRLPLEDTIRLFQTNQTINLMPRVMLAGEKIQQVIQLTLTRTDLTDRNIHTSGTNAITSDIAMLNYIVSVIPASLNINSGISYIGMTNSLASRKNYILMLGINKSFFKNKLNLGINTSGGRSKVNEIQGKVVNASGSVLFKPLKKHGFKFFVYFQNNAYPETSAQKSYKEFKTNVSYVYSL